MVHHEANEIIWKLGELIDVLACVAAVWNAESKVKVKVLQEAPLEIMSLNHTEAVNRTVPHGELNSGTDSAKFKEGWCELIPDKATSTGVQISNLLLMLQRVFVFSNTENVKCTEWNLSGKDVPSITLILYVGYIFVSFRIKMKLIFRWTHKSDVGS